MNSIKVEETYLDFNGQSVMILSEEIPCCVLKHYKGIILGTDNIYCYDTKGRRLHHKWKIDPDSVYNLNITE